MVSLQVEAGIERAFFVQQPSNFPMERPSVYDAARLAVPHNALPDAAGKQLVDIKMHLLVGQQQPAARAQRILHP